MAAPKKVAATEKKEVVEELTIVPIPGDKGYATLEKKVPIPTEKKSRCDFKDWDEYWSYKGPKA